MEEVAVERALEESPSREDDAAALSEDVAPPDTGPYVTYPGEGR
ncbi:MAG TPA: hypothetical protein VMT17_04200 [Anaeromyxobacteraceae bacterium]|nr:hypothetical protein [Anaeromyxobacteraceae bacterium]